MMSTDVNQLLESPGFRFKPTAQELVGYYLKRKLLGKKVSSLLITELDIYKHAPWDLPQMNGLRAYKSSWYFFCPRPKKCSRSSRINDFGFWKSTGKDIVVYCNNKVVGKRKILVFYQGRAPHGEKTHWVIHEYSMEEEELANCKEIQDWYVLCEIFMKHELGRKPDMPWDEPSEWTGSDDSQDSLAFSQNSSMSCLVESMPDFDSDVSSLESLRPDSRNLVVPGSGDPVAVVPGSGDSFSAAQDSRCSFASDRCDSGESTRKSTATVGRPGCYKRENKSETWTIISPTFEDSHTWRKYGQKEFLNSNFPRSYYRCTLRYALGCKATKQVQKLEDNPNKYRTTYIGRHTCEHILKAPPLLISGAVETTVGDPSLLANRGICVSTSAEEDFVNCRGIKNIDSKTDDDQLSFDYSAGRRPVLYLRKLVNLLLLLNPSRTVSPNLRAECLVEVYLPGSHNALLQDLVNLKHLDLSFSSYTKLPDLSRACKLQSLNLHGCNNLVDVLSIQFLTKLEYINLKGCTALMSLPSLMALKCLCSLDVSDCMNLRSLPPSLGCLSNLVTLDLRNCKRIKDLPKGILRLKSLQSLSISGCSMLMEHASQSVPEGMLIEHQQNPGVHCSLHTLDAEVSTSYQAVGKYASKVTLQQPREVRICDKHNSTGPEDAARPSLERISMCSPVTSQPPPSCDNNSDTTLSSDLSALHRDMLKGYMNMPVEAIHQANAINDVKRLVESLNQQSCNMHESDCNPHNNKNLQVRSDIPQEPSTV